MSIVKFAENYFLRLYHVHHKNRLTKEEKVKTTLVVLSCFTLIIPGFFALIYGLSGLLGRGKPLKEAPKPVQEVAKKIEDIAQEKLPEAPSLPQTLLEHIPHIQFEGYSGQFYIKEILAFLKNENEEEQKALFQSAAKFSNLRCPGLFSDLLLTMRATHDPELCEEVSQAFSPAFKELPEKMLCRSISDILSLATSKDQVQNTARVFQKLFHLPNDDNALQKILHKLFNHWITDEVADLIDEHFAEAPPEEMAWAILDGLCPRMTNIQAKAREQCNFTFLMQNPEVLDLGLNILNKHLFCRIVARNLFMIKKRDLPPIVVHLARQFRDYPSAQSLMNYLDTYLAPATPQEFYDDFDRLRPYPREHLDLVNQEIHDYLSPCLLHARRDAAFAALKAHPDELKELVTICRELFYDYPAGFILLTNTPMPKRKQVVDLFKEEVLGNGLLADFPEKPTAFPVIQKLIEMDLETAENALLSIAQKFEKPIEGNALAQLLMMQQPAYGTL
jgi:hypothetical protein